MKSWIVLLAFFLNIPLLKANSDLGVGLFLGIPSGISFKKNLSPKKGWDGLVGWNLGQPRAEILIQSAYLADLDPKRWSPSPDFITYYGLGGRFLYRSSETMLGARFPLGLKYLWYQQHKNQIELYGETALALNLIPSIKLGLDLGIGFRFYF